MTKTTMTTLFLCMAVLAVAQVPQGVSYQAVAVDNNGTELTDQQIAVQASILSGNINGNVEWVETHELQTDEFGLFTMALGTGDPQGGLVATFAEIPWGDRDFFLKIEIDPSGGNNFEMVGVNQILSVPFALMSDHSNTAEIAEFANTAGFADSTAYADTAAAAIIAIGDLDPDPTNEIQTLGYDSGSLTLSGSNSVFIDINDADSDPMNEIQDLQIDGVNLGLSQSTSMIDLSSIPFYGPGADYDFPQGMFGEYVLIGASQYTVPQGKSLYLTASNLNIVLPAFATVNMGLHSTTPNMPVFPAGTTISNCECTGFLVEESDQVEAVIVNLANGATYSVPQDKTLFVKSGLRNINAANLIINGSDLEFYSSSATNGSRIITVPGGSLVRSSDSRVITGYLIEMPQ